METRVNKRVCKRLNCRENNNGVCTYTHNCNGRWIKPKKNKFKRSVNNE